MRVRAAGGAPVRLTRVSAYYQQLAWAPDGNRIVAIRASDRDLREAIDPFVGDGLGAEFVWVPAAGGDVTVIGPTNGRAKPHFTTDTGRIFSYGFVVRAGQSAGNGGPGFDAVGQHRPEGASPGDVAVAVHFAVTGPHRKQMTC